MSSNPKSASPQSSDGLPTVSELSALAAALARRAFEADDLTSAAKAWFALAPEQGENIVSIAKAG